MGSQGPLRIAQKMTRLCHSSVVFVCPEPPFEKYWSRPSPVKRETSKERPNTERALALDLSIIRELLNCNQNGGRR